MFYCTITVFGFAEDAEDAFDLGVGEVPFRPGCIANRKRRLENVHLAYFTSKTNAINTLTELKKKKTEMEIELLKLSRRKMMLEIFNSENSLHK